MTLLFALIRQGVENIHAAHCNFQLRGEESDGDQLMVQNFCRDKGIPFHTVRFETEKYAKEQKISTQMAARELRYEWLEKIRRENGLHLIAVAHHKDDQTETILLQMIQGTGLKGLKGMLPKNGKIVRPLLNVSREEINAYVAQNDIPYREDSSNFSTDYKRNFIRKKISPLIEQLNPNYLQEFSDFAQRMHESFFLFNEQVNKIRKNVLADWKEGFCFYYTSLTEHPSRDTLFFELLSPFGLNRYQVKEIVLNVTGHKRKNISGQTFYSESHRFIMAKKSIYILPINADLTSMLTFDKWPGQIVFNEYRIAVDIKPVNKVNLKKSARFAYLDADKIDFPVLIRYLENADYFYPFGLGKAQNPNKTGKKKLSKFFKDENISLAERERVPLIFSKDRLLWVVGYRIDDRFKITEKTKRVVQLTIHKGL